MFLFAWTCAVMGAWLLGMNGMWLGAARSGAAAFQRKTCGNLVSSNPSFAFDA